MLQLSNPALLFDGQRLYKVNSNVDKSVAATTHYKLVLVYSSPQAELPEAHKIMLDKLIAACGLKATEAIYLNQAQKPALTLGQISAAYTPEMVLIFGDLSLSRNIERFKKNAINTLSDTRIIRTESIENVHTKPAEKTSLWNALKKAYGL